MKIKTSELTGVDLDWAVAKALRYPTKTMPDYGGALWQCGPGHWQPLCKYSTDWAQAGPIIEREKIELNRCPTHGGIHWAANGSGFGCMKYGPTPLVAAMRCYCASKLGDEVEVPDGLAPTDEKTTLNHTVDDAIKNANAHLNNVGLPNYSMLMDTMRYLLSQAKLSDIGERNAAVLRAEEMTRQYVLTVQT